MDPKEILRQKWAKMGVGNAGTIVQESVVAPTVHNVDRYQKLMAIKNGSSRDKIKELVNAQHVDGAPEIAGTTLSGPSSFTPLKVPKPKNRPGAKEEKTTVIPVQEFRAPSAGGDAGQLGSIANMFDERPGVNTAPSPQYSQSSVPQQSYDINQVMDNSPSFNLSAAKERIRQKNVAAEKSKDNQYLNYSLAAKANIEENMEQIPVPLQHTHAQSSNQIDVDMLRTMMESIARGIVESVAEKKMQNVLDSYLQKRSIPQVSNNPKSIQLERYGTDKGSGNVIAKDVNGHYYKLVPVTFKG